MKQGISGPVAVVVAYFAVGLTPLALASQESLEAVNAGEIAEAVLEQAKALSSSPKDWEKAVHLYRQSAELRPATDPLMFECSVTAGNLLMTFGDFEEALETFEVTAHRAEVVEDFFNAAMGYYYAAIAAKELGDRGLAVELAARARGLADAPGLEVEHREEILRRVGDS